MNMWQASAQWNIRSDGVSGVRLAGLPVVEFAGLAGGARGSRGGYPLRGVPDWRIMSDIDVRDAAPLEQAANTPEPWWRRASLPYGLLGLLFAVFTWFTFT